MFPRVENMKSWHCENNFNRKMLNRRASGTPRFWICLWFWICKGYENMMVLNMLGLHGVLNMSAYAWIIPEYVWLWLNLPKYVWICPNMPEYVCIGMNMSKFMWLALVLQFSTIIPCLLECVITYFIIYTKLEVIVWRKVALLSWQCKIWCSL